MTNDEIIAEITSLELRLVNAFGAEARINLRRQLQLMRLELLGYVPPSADLVLSNDIPVYHANGVRFDGADPQQVYTNGITTPVSTDFSFSFWVNIEAISNTFEICKHEADGSTGNFYLDLSMDGSGLLANIEFSCWAPGWATNTRWGVTLTSPAALGWHHIMGTADFAHAAGEKIWKILLDGVDALTIGTENNIQDNAADSFVWYPNPTNDFIILSETGVVFELADFWMSFDQSFLVGGVIPEELILKFRTADGKPVDLGADGSTPTGTAPQIFRTGDATAFLINVGSGGGTNDAYTGPTDAATSPSD
jgi:hypothetical protein